MAARRAGGPNASLTSGVAVALALLVLAAAPAATRTGALFNDVQAATAALAADILQPPTGLGVAGGTTATLTWTPTGDAYAAGYRVERAPASGGSYALVGSATPGSATGYVDGPTTDGTYWYRVTTYAGSWQSTVAGPASAVVKVGVTGYRACTAQAADTGGDANGYEGSPADGCAVDGLAATDVDSGTGTGTGCTGSGKDKHRFSAFGLGVPGTAAAISGITVRLRVGIDATAGTNRVCAALSWNAGTNWTTAQSVALTSTALTTYSLGSSSFLWGRTWTPAQLSDANFRVRVIDVSNSNARDFSIDGVEVQVVYVP